MQDFANELHGTMFNNLKSKQKALDTEAQAANELRMSRQ